MHSIDYLISPLKVWAKPHVIMNKMLLTLVKSHQFCVIMIRLWILPLSVPQWQTELGDHSCLNRTLWANKQDKGPYLNLCEMSSRIPFRFYSHWVNIELLLCAYYILLALLTQKLESITGSPHYALCQAIYWTIISGNNLEVCKRKKDTPSCRSQSSAFKIISISWF